MSCNIIGISAFYHDSACCILQDGVLTAAAQEERFSRMKNDPSLPKAAFTYCLKEAGLTISDIDCIAYYENPVKKLARQLWSRPKKLSAEKALQLDARVIEKQLREQLGYEKIIKYYDHHLSHAASSFFFSGFERAAILTTDGVGEWATTTYGIGEGKNIELFEQVDFPNSIGLLYGTMTSYLGFHVNSGEYKVMGLAPYGQPKYVDKVRSLIKNEPGGKFRLDMKYFDFTTEERMYTDALVDLFGYPPREKESEIQQFYTDVAKSLQVVLEEILLSKAEYLYAETGADDLCMAGGVALNCVANSYVLKNGPFRRLFVQPAANDSGGAVGAAALANAELNDVFFNKKLEHVYLGPQYRSTDIERLLRSTSMTYKSFSDRPIELLELTAQRLAEGKVVGWFQGRMEFGPRSLGARSILADPRSATMRDRINAMVKKREAFRPFAPAVNEHKAKMFFDLDHSSPFMLETCQVISAIGMPAITHVDNSARVQTVSRETNARFYDLLDLFEKLTGCPVLLNTSFNVRGEPIVCSPEDALICFAMTEIDILVLEDFFIDAADNDKSMQAMIYENLVQWIEEPFSFDVYTFM